MQKLNNPLANAIMGFDAIAVAEDAADDFTVGGIPAIKIYETIFASARYRDAG
jgi:hypothetical protein